ncbi:fam-l protein [Plasmodium malariae]|uniref:Fam-l protein n=1 Tax=Plasmodium malariae TaxID=5858 RepID=A0A1D3JHD7_PLAMA|nr:fam-l protein [Plasmodium malariae]SBT85717.1 fam-l protein [Plasmodium malariae]
MEQKIKSLLFIKIINSEFNKSLVESYNNRSNLYKRNYRLMAKYKRDKLSTTVCLKEEVQNGVQDKKDINNNEKWDEYKKKQSCGSSSMSTRGHKKNKKNKSCIFETNKYSNLEKKIFKELDYVDFLRNNRTISNKIYKKIMRKKCSLRIVLPLLLLLFLLITFILDLSNSFGLVKGLCEILNLYASKFWYSSLHSFLKKFAFKLVI